MRTKTGLSITVSICALLCAGYSPGARADESSSIQSFFSAAQGHYSGTGKTEQFSATGTQETNYDIDLVATVGEDGSLTLDSHTETESGNPGSSQIGLRLVNGILYYGTVAASAIPVRVLAATPTSLDYSFEVTGYDGEIYTTENRFSLNDNAIAAHDTVSVNGAVIQTDDFAISRF